MLILFWNVRGLSKSEKCRMTTGNIIRPKEEIVCVCETKLMAPSIRLTNALGARKVHRWVSKDTVGASGGT